LSRGMNTNRFASNKPATTPKISTGTLLLTIIKHHSISQ
jgi:hypothetical protein